MDIVKHGIVIGVERVNEHVYLSLKATGTLTHQDYQLITPMLESALEHMTHPVIDAFIDGTELDGWEARAAWDDLKLGLKHGSKFNKIAIVGNKPWQQLAVKVGAWFISGEIKYFEQKKEATNWLLS